jgi:DNA-directed RNA polymerase specialized sigma24 family protein
LLRVIAEHLAIDLWRRTPDVSTVAFEEQRHAHLEDDDRVSALFDRSAAASDVRRAIREAGDAGETRVVEVIATWLGLAAAEGEAPSHRRVAERLGITHTTVRRALRTFGKRLPN